MILATVSSPKSLSKPINIPTVFLYITGCFPWSFHHYGWGIWWWTPQISIDFQQFFQQIPASSAWWPAPRRCKAVSLAAKTRGATCGFRIPSGNQTWLEGESPTNGLNCLNRTIIKLNGSVSSKPGLTNVPKGTLHSEMSHGSWGSWGSEGARKTGLSENGGLNGIDHGPNDVHFHFQWSPNDERAAQFSDHPGSKTIGKTIFSSRG